MFVALLRATMQSTFLITLFGATTVLLACGDSSASSGTSNAGGAGGGTSSSGGSTSSSTGGQGGQGGGASGPVEPPVIDSVEPLGGGLHVMWTNVTPDCDMIEFDRNKDGGAFATEFTVTGSADSYHDAAATAPGTYCYVARCMRGADVSADSAEMCGTP